MYRGIMIVLLTLTVTLIVDHSYFTFTQCIILRIKISKCRSSAHLPLFCFGLPVMSSVSGEPCSQFHHATDLAR
jgi:hypothetical protein